MFPILCATEPERVAELHEAVTAFALHNVRALLPAIAPYADIVRMAADDWGTQCNTIASPQVYRELFLPYRRRINDEIHRCAPGVKTFLHSCDAVCWKGSHARSAFLKLAGTVTAMQFRQQETTTL